MRDEFRRAHDSIPATGRPSKTRARTRRIHRAPRAARTRLLGALAHGRKPSRLVIRIYTETRRILWPAAARQMLAYLLALQDERRVIAVKRPCDDGRKTPSQSRLVNVVGPSTPPSSKPNSLDGATRYLYRYELA